MHIEGLCNAPPTLTRQAATVLLSPFVESELRER
jgi:hypothetical protein